MIDYSVSCKDNVGPKNKSIFISHSKNIFADLNFFRAKSTNIIKQKTQFNDYVGEVTYSSLFGDTIALSSNDHIYDEFAFQLTDSDYASVDRSRLFSDQYLNFSGNTEFQPLTTSVYIGNTFYNKRRRKKYFYQGILRKYDVSSFNDLKEAVDYLRGKFDKTQSRFYWNQIHLLVKAFEYSLDIKLEKNKNRIKNISRLLCATLVIDARSSFRKVISFFFKNMDDSSDNSNAYYFTVNKHYLISQLNFNEQAKSTRANKHYKYGYKIQTQ